MKPTPGPWTTDAQGAIFGPDGRPIQTCGIYAVRFGEGTEEAYANARLIAAAPDLLEALVKAAIPLEAIHASVHWELAEELKDAVADAVSVIRKAIAKAGG